MPDILPPGPYFFNRSVGAFTAPTRTGASTANGAPDADIINALTSEPNMPLVIPSTPGNASPAASAVPPSVQRVMDALAPAPDPSSAPAPALVGLFFRAEFPRRDAGEPDLGLASCPTACRPNRETRMLDAYGVPDVFAVTEAFHLRRTLEEIRNAPPGWMQRPVTLRERQQINWITAVAQGAQSLTLAEAYARAAAHEWNGGDAPVHLGRRLVITGRSSAYGQVSQWWRPGYAVSFILRPDEDEMLAGRVIYPNGDWDCPAARTSGGKLTFYGCADLEHAEAVGRRMVSIVTALAHQRPGSRMASHAYNGDPCYRAPMPWSLGSGMQAHERPLHLAI